MHTADIPLIREPKTDNFLGIDIVPIKKTYIEDMNVPHRLQFHIIVLVTSGTVSYQIDFDEKIAQAGDIIHIPPHHILHFAQTTSWEGLFVRYQTELLLPHQPTLSLDDRLLLEQPYQWRLNDEEQTQLTQLLAIIRSATLKTRKSEHLHNLLRGFLSVLVIFGDSRVSVQDKNALNRFYQFQRLLEQQFSFNHNLAKYAELLHCTPRSLSRTCLALKGVAAKKVINHRLVLEAKRLLVYTDLSVKQISAKLGFEENTNFTKFFKRETGILPSDFRQQTLAAREQQAPSLP